MRQDRDIVRRLGMPPPRGEPDLRLFDALGEVLVYRDAIRAHREAAIAAGTIAVHDKALYDALDLALSQFTK